MGFLKTSFGIDDIRFASKPFALTRVSSFVFLGCSLLVVTHRFLETPIVCASSERFPSSYIESYCLSVSTSVDLEAIESSEYRSRFSENGSRFPGAFSNGEESNPRLHLYYNFVHILLLGHALIFFFPGYLWARWEGNLIKGIAKENSPCCIPDEKQGELLDKINLEYLKGFGERGRWVRRYVLCEAIYLLSIILNLVWINFYLNGNFMALEALSIRHVTSFFSVHEEIFQMKFFPSVVMCAIRALGPSGASQLIRVQCVLPLNPFHFYIYLFLAFWMTLLLVDACIFVVTRLVLYCSSYLRMLWVVKIYGKADTHTDANLRSRTFTFGDWILLNLLSQTMERSDFSTLLRLMAERMDQLDAPKSPS